MQTFLPYPDFTATAKVLDRQRLGKQRVETVQIINALTLPEYGWKNHPAVKMWRGYVPALAAYGYAMSEEWMRRGYRDTKCVPVFLEHYPPLSHLVTDPLRFCAERLTISYTLPPWMGDPGVHSSHRSRLLLKNPVWYSQFEWSEPPGMEYVWPVN